MFTRYCVAMVMVMLCTEEVSAMRIRQKLGNFGARARVASQRSLPKFKLGSAGRAFITGVTAAGVAAVNRSVAGYVAKKVEEKTVQKPMTIYAWLNPKAYWEDKYRDLLEHCGTKDPEQKYQDEFQKVVKLFKAKGLLTKDSVIFLKLMGPESVEIFKKNGWTLYGNAFVAADQQHFVHAHETLLSDTYTSDERIARFAHELVHMAIHQNPKIRIFLAKRKWEEFVCDVVSVIALQNAEGASKLMRHHQAVLGDTHSNMHPKPSTREKYFDALDPWVKPVNDDEMHDLIKTIEKMGLS